MFNIFNKIECKCTFCENVWRIPRRRIRCFEKYFNIKPGQPFVWECHDCHEGIVIPGEYINIHGEKVVISPETLGSDIEVMRF